MIYLILCNNLCKCHNVFPPRTIQGKNGNYGFSINNAGGKELSARQKINLDMYLILHTKTNLTWVFE
jgi:hypothetical protein